jgi:hypothetical protein
MYESLFVRYCALLTIGVVPQRSHQCSLADTLFRLVSNRCLLHSRCCWVHISTRTRCYRHVLDSITTSPHTS